MAYGTVAALQRCRPKARATWLPAAAQGCGYTTTPAARCSVALPVYNTNPPPDDDTEISESTVAGEATAPFAPAAAAGGAWLPARRRQQTQGALRKYSSVRMKATASRPSASAAANMSGW